jgi:hypothetical protein
MPEIDRDAFSLQPQGVAGVELEDASKTGLEVMYLGAR